MLSFLFVEEGNLLFKKSSFEEFNIIFFTAERMVCFQMQPRQLSFLLNFQVHFALYGQENGSDRQSAPQAYECKITQSTGMENPNATRSYFGGKSHSHPLHN